MSSMTAMIDMRCAECQIDTRYMPSYGRVFWKGKCYCSYACYMDKSLIQKPILYKICCICNCFMEGFAKHEVSKGLICSNKCFHLWLDEGMAKYVQHVAEKAICQQQAKK